MLRNNLALKKYTRKIAETLASLGLSQSEILQILHECDERAWQELATDQYGKLNPEQRQALDDMDPEADYDEESLAELLHLSVDDMTERYLEKVQTYMLRLAESVKPVGAEAPEMAA